MWPFTRKQPEERDALTDYVSYSDRGQFEPNTFAGVVVDTVTALTLPAVFRCVDLNSSTVASLPMDCLVKRGQRREAYPYPPLWLTRPSPDYGFRQFIQEVQCSLEIDGNAFLLKITSDRGMVVGLLHLAPQLVAVVRALDLPGQPIIYRVQTANGVKDYGPTEVVHIKAFTTPRGLRGLSPIAAAAQTIGQGLAAQQFGAQWFGTGANLSGVIEVAKALNQEQAERLKESFAKKHGGVRKSHAIGILEGGATWKPMSVSAEESQFLKTIEATSVMVAFMYGVPPEYVTTAEGAKGYVTGLYARQAMWLQTGINPRLIRIEDALSALLPNNAYVRFNRRALLQMDPQERASYMGVMWDRGVINDDEWRALEDMDPKKDGGRYYVPLNFKDEAAPPPEPKPAPVQLPLPIDAGEPDEDDPEDEEVPA